MKKYTVTMRVSSGEMRPSYEKFLISGVSLRVAIAAIKNDLSSPDSFFLQYEEGTVRVPVLFSLTETELRPRIRQYPCRDYYICAGEARDIDNPHSFTMSRSRVLLPRGLWLKNGFPLPTEWKWRKPLF
ncbi:MAG: hypothetical protein WC823_01570 [Parcubacteria group bacterium]|jgi:hypothetical protein